MPRIQTVLLATLSILLSAAIAPAAPAPESVLRVTEDQEEFTLTVPSSPVMMSIPEKTMGSSLRINNGVESKDMTIGALIPPPIAVESPLSPGLNQTV